MRAPERLTVPTCVGCGAMTEFGTCETGCSEHRLELVPAAVHDSLGARGVRVRARSQAFRPVVEELACCQPSGEDWEGAYRAVQDRARSTLRRYPGADEEEAELQEPIEPATTWWCAECGGIDAPQPCLGICIWRPVEWVNRVVYEPQRERVLAERETELRLSRLLRRLASVTPRHGHWERGWRVLQAEAKETLSRFSASPSAN